MQSRKFTGTVVFLFFTIILTNSAFATYFATFDEMYMTGGNGSYESKTEFGWTETPWLYLKLPETGLNLTGAVWESPDQDYYLTGDIGYGDEIWLSLGSYWDEIKTAGEWEIKAGFVRPFSSPQAGFGSTSFSVALPHAPEPVSSILFITGAATLGFRRYCRKRKTV